MGGLYTIPLHEWRSDGEIGYLHRYREVPA